MIRLTKPARVVFLLSFVAFILTVVGLVWVAYLIQQKGVQYETELALVASADQQAQLAQSLQQQLQATEAERQQLETYFLDVVQVAQFLEQIETYARANNLRLRSTSLNEVTESVSATTQLMRVRIPYEVSGSRFAVMRFINLLETLPYHSDIQRLRLRSATNDAEQVTAEIELLISSQLYDRTQ